MADEKKTTTKRKRKASNKKTNPSTEAKAAIVKQNAIDAEAKKVADEKAERLAKEEQARKDAEAAAVEEKATAEAKPKVEKKPKPNKIKLPEVERVQILLKDFEEASPKGRPATESMRARRLEKLVKLITFASNTPKREVLDEILVFFKKERLGLMSEAHILQGVSRLNSSTREKVEVMYGALVITVSNIRAKRKIRPNIELISKRLGDGVASWFATKNK